MLITTLTACRGQKNLASEFSPIVLQAKETSLYANQIDWNKVNNKFVKLTTGKSSIEQKKAGYQYLINSLKDKHAMILDAKDHSIVTYYTGDNLNTDTREFSQEFMQNEISNPDVKYSTKLLDDGVGLVKLVRVVPGGNVKQESEEIRKGIVDLKNQNVNKWIVDLRYNSGGNMNPMIAGLAPLIGEGKIGGSVNLKGETMAEMTIKDSQFYNYGQLVCEMDNSPIIDPSEKVVVLLSRYTISSGEMTAISFKGRPNTLFIGEATGGLTTGNGYDLINDEVYLVISQGVFSDRNDRPYLDNVGVDEFIEFDTTWTVENDEQIKKAKEWLKE